MRQMNKEISVSILCCTYNQNKYLEAALESMLKQKTTFKYEIVVHDDASTDGTRDIIRKYQAEYPDIVKPIYENTNQYSQGIDFMKRIILHDTSGEYIALCEGDDFWIDEQKLELQYQIMEKHPDCDMCACWGCTVSEDGTKEISQIRPQIHDGILKEEDVILEGGQYIITAGLFFRKSMFDKIMEFEKHNSLDYEFQIKGGLRGGIYYLDRKMAAYRRYAQNSWTINVLHNDVKLKLQWDYEKRMLRQLDQDTNGQYHTVIEKRLLRYTPFEEQLENHKKDIFHVIRENPTKCYIWGLGRRGESLEKFFYANDIHVSGVCDAMNNQVGAITKYGNKIVSTEYAMANANSIFASTKVAYDDLVKTNFRGELIDFQNYMPLSP